MKVPVPVYGSFPPVAVTSTGADWPKQAIGLVIVAEATSGAGCVTVIVNEHVLALPEASVAVYVTVVVPTGNCAPELKLEVTVALPQLSVAVGAVQVAATDVEQAGIERVISVGQFEKTGLMESVLFTVKVQVEMLLAASFADKVIVTGPVPLTAVPAAGDWVFTIDANEVQLSE